MNSHNYTLTNWSLRGGRPCERKVSCPRTQHMYTNHTLDRPFHIARMQRMWQRQRQPLHKKVMAPFRVHQKAAILFLVSVQLHQHPRRARAVSWGETNLKTGHQSARRNFRRVVFIVRFTFVSPRLTALALRGCCISVLYILNGLSKLYPLGRGCSKSD